MVTPTSSHHGLFIELTGDNFVSMWVETQIAHTRPNLLKFWISEPNKFQMGAISKRCWALTCRNSQACVGMPGGQINPSMQDMRLPNLQGMQAGAYNSVPSSPSLSGMRQIPQPSSNNFRVCTISATASSSSCFHTLLVGLELLHSAISLPSL